MVRLMMTTSSSVSTVIAIAERNAAQRSASRGTRCAACGGPSAPRPTRDSTACRASLFAARDARPMPDCPKVGGVEPGADLAQPDSALTAAASGGAFFSCFAPGLRQKNATT